MTILVSGGDSFVWGSELSDQTTSYSESTFPALLAKQFNLSYICSAWPSNANNAITRMSLAQCHQLIQQNKKIVVLIMWTFSSRFEFRFNYNTRQKISPWYSISPWTTLDDTTHILEHFKTDNKDIEYQQIKNIKTAQESGVANFAKLFNKDVGNSEYYELYSTFKEIVFMQNYLKVNNIPYLFTTADWQEENYTRCCDVFLSSLYDSIDWKNWYFFPAGTRVNETQKPRGFYQWAVENKYKIGTTHPLEDAHKDASTLIQEKFNEMVKKSI